MGDNMNKSTYRMSDYTVKRPGLLPAGVVGEVTVVGEVRSDQTLQYLDCAIGFLHGASQYLELEIPLCPTGSERAGEIASLFSRQCRQNRVRVVNW